MMTDNTAIRPFHVGFPEAELTELNRRKNDPLARPRTGCRYNTRRAARDNTGARTVLGERLRLAQMRSEAGGPAELHHRNRRARHPLHHVRSKHDNALPMIVTHGWPGSVVEQMKIIDPLTNPTAHGATAADAFHLVIPSLPGYGFSGKPTAPGWSPPRIAKAWAVLMQRLDGDHGRAGAAGFARHPHQHAGHRFARNQRLARGVQIARVFAGQTEGLSKDDILDNVTLYWLTITPEDLNLDVPLHTGVDENVKPVCGDARRPTRPDRSRATPECRVQAPQLVHSTCSSADYRW